MKIRPTHIALAITVLTALAIAGCGSSSQSSTSTASNTSPTPATTQSTGASGATGATQSTPSSSSKSIQISADPSGQPKFVPASVTTAAGKHKFVFVNKSGVVHDLIIGKGYSEGGQLGEVKKISSGTETTKAVDLKPGKYSFYCDVDGHRQAGMHGTIVVK